MAALIEGMHTGEFIGELAMSPGYHIDKIVLDTGKEVGGQLLTRVETGTPEATVGTPVAGAGGTIGNGTITEFTCKPGAMAGEWLLICTATGDTGKFRVMRPDGTLDGILTIGTEYDGDIVGTVGDGANNWLVDDLIPITVSYAPNLSEPKYVAYDGTGSVDGILMKNTDASGGDAVTTALVRGPATVNVNDLTFFEEADDDDIAEAVARLMDLGIKAA